MSRFPDSFNEFFGKTTPAKSTAERDVNYATAVGVERGFKLAQQTFVRWVDDLAKSNGVLAVPAKDVRALAQRIRNAKHSIR